MASQGLVSTCASMSTLRAPGLSSRVKQSCRLSKRCLLASLRSRSVNSRHTPIEARKTQGLRILLNQPMKRVSSMARHAVGEQEVQVFLQQQAVAQWREFHGLFRPRVLGAVHAAWRMFSPVRDGSVNRSRHLRDTGATRPTPVRVSSPCQQIDIQGGNPTT